MKFTDLLKNEFMKVKRSKIVPLIFIAPLLVVTSGIANISSYFTPEYTNAWAAMFIQSALLYAYYLLPFSMIVVCVMISSREKSNNGILKMLALPLNRHSLSIAKFCVVIWYLFLEIIVFLTVFLVIPGILMANTPLWIVYPYCYSGYLVSCSLHEFTLGVTQPDLSLSIFVPFAVMVFGSMMTIAAVGFGRKEMR